MTAETATDPAAPPPRTQPRPLTAAAVYLAAGLVWIGVSDYLLFVVGLRFGDGFWTAVTKGAGFVALSAALVYALVRRELEIASRSAALLRAVVEASVDAVFVKDRGGRYLLFNPAAGRFVGKDPRAVLGLTDAALFDAANARRMTDWDRRVMAAGRPETVEEVMPANGGGLRTLLTTKYPLRDAGGAVVGVIGVARDVTAERAAAALSQGVLDSVDAHIAVVRPDGAIRAVNAAWARFAEENPTTAGTPRGTGVGANYLSVCDTAAAAGVADAARAAAEVRTVLAGGPPGPGFEYPCHAAAEPRWFRFRVTPLRGNEGGAVVTHSETTAARLAADAVRADRDRFVAVVASVPGMIYSCVRSPDGAMRFTFVGPQAEALFGLPADALLADAAPVFAAIPPDDRARVLDAIDTSARELTPWRQEFRYAHPTRGEIWIEAHSVPGPDPATGGVLWHGYAADQTDRRRADEAARRWQEVFTRAGLNLAVADAATNTFLEVNPAFARDRGYAPAELAGRSILDVYAEGSHDAALAAIAVLERSGHGTFEALHRRKDGTTFPVLMDVTVLPAAGGGPGIRVAAATDLTALYAARQAVEASERRFRVLTEHSADIIAVFDAAGIILYQSPSIRRLGYESGELIGTPLAGLIHPDDRATVEATLRGLFGSAEPSPPVLMRFREKSGAWRWLEATGRFAPGLFGPDGAIVTNSRDVTDRVLAEDALRESEALLSAVLESLPVSVVTADPTGRLVRMNRATRTIWGPPPATEAVAEYGQWVGYWPDTGRRVAADEWPLARALLRGEVTSGVRIEIEPFHGGDRRVLDLSAAPVRDDGGRLLGGVVTCVDVTDRVRAEQAARDSEQRYRALVDYAADAIFLHDQNHAILEVNPQACQSLGLSRDELIGKHPTDFDAAVTPDRLTEIQILLEAGRPVTLESVHRRKDGSTFPVEVRLRPFQVGGRRFGLSVVRDITERRAAEAALRASEARFRAFMDYSPAAVWVVGPDDRVEYLSASFLRLVRLPPGDPIGRTVAELFPPELAARYAERTRAVRASGRVTETTEPGSRPDGTPAEYLVYRFPIPRPDGRVSIGGMALDVTDARRAEEALRARTKLYAMLARTNRAVSRCRSADGLFREVCEIAVEVGGFRFAWVGVPDEAAGRLRPAATGGDDDGYLSRIVVTLDESDPRSHGPSGRAARTGVSTVVNDFLASTSTQPWHDHARRVGFAASAAFPLSERGRVAAVLTLYAGEPGFFTPDLVTTLEEVVPALSFALDALAADRDRARAEAGLRLSEERYRAFMDHNPAAAFVADADGRIQYLSAAYRRLVQLPAGDPIGKTLPELFPPGVAQTYAANIATVARTGQVLIATEPLARADGTAGECLVYKFPVPWTDGRTAVGGVALDITDQRRAEDRLRVLGAAIDSSPNAVFIADRNGVIRWANPAFTAMSGYPADEAVGRTPALLKSGRQDADFYHGLWETVLAGRVWAGEVVERNRAGSEYVVRQTVTPLAGPDGKVAQFVVVHEDVTAQKHAEEQLRQLAVTDPLTGLLNRAGFRDRLAAALTGGPAALHFLDLDRFKLVNDALGHHAGDDLLRQVAERIRGRVRGSDVSGRLGGDEFAVLQLGVRTPADATALARGLVDVVSAPFVVAGQEVLVGASVGVTLYPDDGADPEALLRNADLAMYQAKQEGRSTFRFFTGGLGAQVRARVELETEIRRALDRHEFTLYYQPQVRVADRAIVGAEALVRWNHPSRGTVPPGEFLPVAEDSGLILPLGDWVLRAACRQARVWYDAGRPMRVGVNVSAAQVQRGDLEAAVTDILRDTGLPAELLELEVTESLFLPDAPSAVDVLRRIHALGVGVSIDDFGTGYSSLSYLRRLPVDRLKVDRSFVSGAADEPRDAALVRAIVGLGRDLGLKVIAEGVETDAQLNLLRAEGCDEAQGYLFGRPVPPDRFPAG